jgi:hypothetical protein
MSAYPILTQSFRNAIAGAALLVLAAGISVTLSPAIALAQDHGNGGSKGGHESGGEGDSCGGCEDGGQGSGSHESGSCEDSGGSCEGDSGHGGSGHRGGQGRAPGEASGTHGDRSIEDIFRETPGADASAPAAEGHDGSDESRSHSDSGKSGAGEASPPSTQQGDH